MSTLQSYDLNGKKLSFANWISNLSPEETPFSSMTGKEAISQTLFQWQNDSLNKAVKNAMIEGDIAKDSALKTTTVRSNITQILRKTVKISDTANALSNYGRGKELQYQMEKAGKEIKRDLEWTFMNNADSKAETRADPRETAGFIALCASPLSEIDKKMTLKNIKKLTDPVTNPDPKTGRGIDGWSDPDTGARTVFGITNLVSPDANIIGNEVKESDIFSMTYNLYLAGSSANIIMFHPRWASTFSALQEKVSTRVRMFENTPMISAYVSTLVDPLGQEYRLIPNRWMPESVIYFFAPHDWTQMVLRPPERTKLAKDGSYEKWMIEMEVGLRHRNPFSSGVLVIKSTADDNTIPLLTKPYG